MTNGSTAIRVTTLSEDDGAAAGEWYFFAVQVWAAFWPPNVQSVCFAELLGRPPAEGARSLSHWNRSGRFASICQCEPGAGLRVASSLAGLGRAKFGHESLRRTGAVARATPRGGRASGDGVLGRVATVLGRPGPLGVSPGFLPLGVSAPDRRAIPYLNLGRSFPVSLAAHSR